MPWELPDGALSLPVIVPADYSFSNVILFPPTGEPDTGQVDAVDPGLFLMTGNSANLANPQLLSVGTAALGNGEIYVSLDSNQAPVNSAAPEPGTKVLAASALVVFVISGWKSRYTTPKYFRNTT